ncbi:hypothetical protein [Falsiphaeobacter marinintestinus]|uniref:hypothetical protein n=1 Tax=Falsiphaeobacter marinintestinus TaxID=1492905 RepID=UPI001645CB58|nr:hypothetical protein [Phaeobacter marinintestinus]
MKPILLAGAILLSFTQVAAAADRKLASYYIKNGKTEVSGAYLINGYTPNRS